MPSTSETPSPFPPLPFLPPKVQEVWNRWCWSLADRIIVWNVNDVIGAELKKKGLPSVDHFFSRPADLCLMGMSGPLMAPEGEYDSCFKFTGYLRWQSTDDEEMERELQTFCEGEEVPVLTFGSVAFDNVHGLMSRFLRRWPQGKKLIIQSGWAGLSIELPRPEIKVIGKMSHDQLLRFASCVCHHGGAGTTGSVLHSGKPQIIIPHIADQPFWGRKIKNLGCGTTVVKKRWPERLPGAIRKVEANKEMRAAAEKHALTLKNEDGPRTAVRLLEDFVQQSP